MENLIFLIALVFVAGFIIAQFRSKVEQAKKVNDMWRRFAQGKGLAEEKPQSHFIKNMNIKTLSEAFQSLDPVKSKPGASDSVFKGNNQGFPCALETVTVKKGDSYQIYTRISLEIPGLPKDLEIRPETRTGIIGKMFGRRDIAFQDEPFDHAFIVQGGPPNDIKTFLTARRRMALVDFSKYQSGLHIRNGKLFVIRKGQVEKISELDQLYSRTGELGRMLSTG